MEGIPGGRIKGLKLESDALLKIEEAKERSERLSAGGKRERGRGECLD